MYQWYQKAQTCYPYLAEVYVGDEDLRKSYGRNGSSAVSDTVMAFAYQKEFHFLRRVITMATEMTRAAMAPPVAPPAMTPTLRLNALNRRR